jgi:hypothetical protein
MPGNSKHSDRFFTTPTPATKQTSKVSPADNKCPKCHAQVKAGSIICIQCGTNLKTGANATTLHKEPKKGSFALATTIASITAIAAGLIWGGITIATNMEIGIIAWIIGVAVGGSLILTTPESV